MRDQTPGESTDSAEFGVGSLIAGYRLEERIGRGGMAVVYRAYDARLDRQVALKILAPGLAEDDAFRQRFIRESRAAAAVDDPHITPVFEAGEANGVLFIAMRYVRGGDVGSLISRLGQLPVDRAAEILSQVASALDAAHARGLVHRDVKPANMLLEASSAADRPDHVYLSDFGLSKTSMAVSGLTATGQFLGTLEYVAPEQIEGRQLDGRTDVYALACSAFEMLTGQPPFRRDQGMSVMFAHLSEPPPLARQRRPDLPSAIDEVLLTALAKAPADRYQTCREFAAAFRRAAGPGLGRRTDTAPASHPATQVASPVVRPEPPPPDVRWSDPRQPDLPKPDQARPAPATPDPQIADPTSPRDAPPRLGPPRRPVVAAAEPARGQGQAADHDAPPTEVSGRNATGVAGGADGFQAGPTSPWPGSGPPARRSARRPALVAAASLLVVLVGGGAYLLSGHLHAASTGGSSHAASTMSLALPGCTTATAKAPTLSHVTSAVATLDGGPFGVVATPDGQYAFVTVGDAIDVMRTGPSLTPILVRTIAAPGAGKDAELTSDGKFLLAAAGSGAYVINVAEAEQGAPYPVVGTLTSPTGSGAVQVLITADSHYAFVTLQNSAEMAVFNLQQALAQGISAADFVGYVPLGDQPVGLTTDGTWLYVTDFSGNLNVLSLSRAATDPAHAVVARVAAGCQPARAIMSADHQVVWVTARGSDALLGFSAVKLRTDPRHALIAKVMVGEVPLGEALVDHGARIVVADSNLNALAGVPSNVAVISTADALSGRPALLGYLSTGLVPRQFALVPGGATLLVTVQGAHEVQAIKAGDLP